MGGKPSCGSVESSVVTPASLLAAALEANPSGPLLTFYDDDTGERIELSATSFDNWVAKTANLLRDGLDAQPGERIELRLPPHWQGAVWILAAWSAGLVVSLEEVDILVCGPAPVTETDARDVVALSLRPLGGPFITPLPAGVLDYGAEVFSYGDHFVPYAPVADADPALVSAGVVHTGGELVEAAVRRAGELALTSGSRVLTRADPASVSGCVDALLAPLAAGASVVLVRNADPARREGRLAEEKVTHEI